MTTQLMRFKRLLILTKPASQQHEQHQWYPAFSKVIVSIALIALVSACSGPAGKEGGRHGDKGPDKQRQQPIPVFSTEVTADGTKLFSLRLDIPEREFRPSGKRGPQTGGKQRDGKGGARQGSADRAESMQTRMEERMQGLLEEQLARTQFCRDGYIILDKYVGRSGSLIRGECREGAERDDESGDGSGETADISSVSS